MIKHIVCFQLHNNSQEEMEKAKEVLLSMKENVPTVRDIQVGLDFLHSPRSYDVILQVELDSREMLDVYQNDPYHVEVVKTHMHRVAKSSITIDYEL